MSIIGDNFRKMRMIRGLSIDQIADKLSTQEICISTQTVSRWQRGITRIPSDIIETMTRVLNCPLSMLIYDENNMPQQSSMVLDTSGMSEHQKQAIRWLQYKWDGDMSVLLEFDLLYSKLPIDIREQIAYEGIRLYQEAIKSNRIDFSQPRVDIGKIIKGWKKIAKI